MSESDVHRDLVHERWPELPLETFEPIGDGWDCFTYLVDGQWVFQFPRLPDAPARIHKLIAILPELALEVSAAIPHPRYVWDGEPPSIGYELIDGTPMNPMTPGIWPERLGRFLYDLHLVPPEFVGMRSGTTADIRAERHREVADLAAHVLPLLDPTERAYAQEMIDTFLGDDANFRFAGCLTHGDIGPAHVLLTDRGDLAGVIDWGDAAVGDPAADLAWVLSAMPAEGERVLAAYGGPPDERFVDRCRFAFTVMPWHEVKYGVETDQPAFVRSGLEGVRERLG